MGGPCPGTVGRFRPDGPDLSATVHQTHPLAVPCLAVAPSTTSQWNQRKLAPNYRLVSVKDGTGAAGVSACGGWVAESLGSRPAEHTEDTRNAQSARDTITRTQRRKAQPPFSGPFVPQSGLLLSSSGCYNRNLSCSVSGPTGLITRARTRTPEEGASGFNAACAPLSKG